MDFFTSDTHFGSERTLTLSKRPFPSVTEMDITMIDRINTVCNKGDTLYHIGDFGNYNVVRMLNPKVILICGNYEHRDYEDFTTFREKLISLGFEDVYEKTYSHPTSKEPLDMIHFPSIRNKDVFTLFGHIHRSQMVKKNALNVGVDVHNYSPVSEDDVYFWKNAILNFYDNDVFCE